MASIWCVRPTNIMIRRISLLFSQILLWVVLSCDAYHVPGPPALLHQPPTQHGTLTNQRGMARTLLMAAAQDNNDTPNSQQQQQQQQTRWDTLPSQTKSRLVEAGQARAVNNKSKRESEMDKKRRALVMFLLFYGSCCCLLWLYMGRPSSLTLCSCTPT